MTQSPDPSQSLLQELLDFSRAAVSGLEVLRRTPEVSVGNSRRDCIHEDAKLRLYRYPPQGQPLQTPLLVVYALVNRPYILDLQPDRSLIDALSRQGVPVYLLDWGRPDAADRYLDLDDYLNDQLDRCVDRIRADHQGQPVNLLGVCQGGTFSLCYSCLEPHKVRNLVTLVTPVDFHTPDNSLAGLARRLDTQALMQAYGNFPGPLMTRAYNSLMPVRLGLHKEQALPRQLSDHQAAATYLRMERWINDCPDLAGAAFVEFLEKFFRDNTLVQGGLQIGGRPINLKQITQPLFNLYAQDDHLVPPSASAALEGLTRSRDFQQKVYPGGHIGVFTGRRTGHRVAADIGNWLMRRDQD